MVRAEHLGRQVRHQPPNFVHLLLLGGGQGALGVLPGGRRLEGIQARLELIQPLGDPARRGGARGWGCARPDQCDPGSSPALA
jgi:hypothetical protein